MFGFLTSAVSTLAYDVGYRYFFGFIGSLFGYAFAIGFAEDNRLRIESMRSLKHQLKKGGFSQALFESSRFKGYIEKLLLASQVDEGRSRH